MREGEERGEGNNREGGEVVKSNFIKALIMRFSLALKEAIFAQYEP
jgi:hypothetical protein